MSQRSFTCSKLAVALAKGGFLSLIGVAGVVAAQDVTEAEVAQAVTPSLDEQVVSATRQGRDAFEVPASVDKVGQEALEALGGFQVNLSETLGRVPGLVINNRNNFAQDLQISIRGFGARATSGVRGVRLIADGIPATQPDGSGQVSHFSLSSAESIEVLRGPFSSLYGNSSGGVILITSRDPEPGAQVSVDQAFGSYGSRRTGVTASFGTEELAWLIDVSRFRTDGYRDHSRARRDNLNSKLVWRPGSDTKVSWIVNYVDMPEVQDPLGLTASQLASNRRQAGTNAIARNTRKSVEQTQSGVVVEHAFSDQTRMTLSPYVGERRVRQVLASGVVIDLANDYYGGDFQLAHDAVVAGRPLALVAGVTVAELEQARLGFPNETALRNRDEDNSASQFDQYIQAEYFLTDRWSVLGGLRNSSIEIQSQDRFLANGDGSGEKQYDEVTANLGVTYRISPNLNTYVSYGEGFETPTLLETAYLSVNPPSPNFNALLGAAKSEQLEWGVKAKYGATRVNAALYSVDTDDEIVVLANNAGATSFQNAGSTRRYGAELLVQQQINEAWGALAAMNWIDAQYRSSTGNIVAGNKIPSIPRKTLFAELSYAPRNGYQAAVEYRYVDRLVANDANSAFAPSYSVMNLRASKEWALQGGFSLRAYARLENVFDKEYVGSVIVNQAAGQFFEPASTRNALLGFNLSYRWK